MGALSGRWQTLTKAAESFESLIVNLISVPVNSFLFSIIILIRCWFKLFFILLKKKIGFFGIMHYFLEQ